MLKNDSEISSNLALTILAKWKGSASKTHIIAGSVIFLLSLMNFGAAMNSTVSLQLQCILSGNVSTASCRGVRVDLMGPLGQVKSNPSRAEDPWKQS